MIIEQSCLTSAWCEALLHTYHNGETSPLVVTIHGFDRMPPEDFEIRSHMDGILAEKNGAWKSRTTANTIFPSSMWRPGIPREDLYKRYSKLYEARLRGIRQNRRGTYFQRLICYGSGEINQLEHIIGTWERKVRRRSAFVASVFDPDLDHKPTPFLGFPCMHQVCFAQQGSDGFSVTGFYAKQDIFDRGYGNYLGLAELGSFMANAFDRVLTRVTCVASVAALCSSRFNKGDLAGLVDSIESLG